MSKTRKKIFPKKPVQFHSGLEKTLGRNSNKTGYDASLKGIYNTPSRVKCPLVLAEWERKQLEMLQSKNRHNTILRNVRQQE